MQVLFIDVLNSDKNNYEIKQDKNFVSLKISDKFIEYIKSSSTNLFKKLKFKIQFKILKLKLKKIISDKVIFIFSLYYDKNVEYKNLINKKIFAEFFGKFYEILVRNNMDENIDKYIFNYKNLLDLKREEIKILYFVDEFNDVVYKSIVKYINEYKFLDISYLGSTNSIKYQNMLSKINNMNNEIGSTISFINADYNMDYNIYINFSLKDVLNKYAISKDFLVINYYDTENDIYNEFNILFRNNKLNIETKLLKIGIEIKNFSVNKLGQLVKNKMIVL